MTEVNITPFDNEISILYKWARHFRTPIKLIVISTEIKGEKEKSIYSNGINMVQALIQSGNDLQAINIRLSDKLETEDIIKKYKM